MSEKTIEKTHKEPTEFKKEEVEDISNTNDTSNPFVEVNVNPQAKKTKEDEEFENPGPGGFKGCMKDGPIDEVL